MRQRILATLLANPERGWYVSELARHLGTASSSLQRELDSLAKAGILSRTESGNRNYFQADGQCPVFVELQRLMTKTVGLAEPLRSALAPLEIAIRCAFVYGSVAGGTETSTSDIDLMLIGEVRLHELSLVLLSAERSLSRPVNPTLYGPAEFTRKLNEGNHFLATIMKQSKLFIIGTEDDLVRIVESQEGSDSRDK